MSDTTISTENQKIQSAIQIGHDAYMIAEAERNDTMKKVRAKIQAAKANTATPEKQNAE